MFAVGRVRRWGLWVAAIVCLTALAFGSRAELSLDELKAKVANASVGDRPPVCLEISERQIGAAGRFFELGDPEQAKNALNDVSAFAELARDYSIQTQKHQKNSEIKIRKLTRKLSDMKHLVAHDDQELVQSTIDKLDKVRDDLLISMFPKVGKK
jgi:ligand-binding sensor domain-containing protein